MIQQIKDEKEDSELKSCTFKPNISPSSQYQSNYQPVNEADKNHKDLSLPKRA